MKTFIVGTAIAAMAASPFAFMITLAPRRTAVMVADPLLWVVDPATAPGYGEAATALQDAQYRLSKREGDLAGAEDCVAQLQGDPRPYRQPCEGTSLDQALQRVETAKAEVIRAKAEVAEAEGAIAAKRPGKMAIGLPVERDTILVMFTHGSTTEQREDLLLRYNLAERSRLDSIAMVETELVDDISFRTPEGSATRLRAVIDRLKATERQIVETAAQNVALDKTTLPGGTHPSPRWLARDAMNRLSDPLVVSGFPATWNVNDALRRRKAQVDVGVLDIGFTTFKPNDLDITSECSPQANHAHGTTVAAIIGAGFDNGQGVDGAAPFARLRGCAPERILTSTDFEGTTDHPAVTTSKVLFADALKHFDTWLMGGIGLINVSMGYNWTIRPSANPTVQRIVESHGRMVRDTLALHSGVIIVSAAGNDCARFPPPCDEPAIWANPFNWAARGVDPAPHPSTPSENVIVVEGWDAMGQVRLPASNSRGMIGAVSVNIPSIVNVRVKATGALEDELGPCTEGTSCAAPLVTAAVAQMLAATPGLTPADVKRFLGIGAPGSPTVPLKALAALQASSPTFEKDVADIGNDGQVDMKDFAELNAAFKLPAAQQLFSRSDFTGDRKVNADDLAIMIRAWTGKPEDAQQLPGLLGK